jgi:hypothetical protein
MTVGGTSGEASLLPPEVAAERKVSGTPSITQMTAVGGMGAGTDCGGTGRRWLSWPATTEQVIAA